MSNRALALNMLSDLLSFWSAVNNVQANQRTELIG
jgi:hypothetical protein